MPKFNDNTDIPHVSFSFKISMLNVDTLFSGLFFTQNLNPLKSKLHQPISPLYRASSYPLSPLLHYYRDSYFFNITTINQPDYPTTTALSIPCAVTHSPVVPSCPATHADSRPNSS